MADALAPAIAVQSRSGTLVAARFEVLDSWRGICALLVTLFHFPAAGLLAANGFVRGSYLFVDFFFVLSGFVIAHAYGGRMGDARALGRFMLTRFGRLFPLHVFMLAAFVAFELVRWRFAGISAGEPAFSGGNTMSSLVTNLFMLHGLGIESGLTWNAPSWSISTEFYAYVLFGLVTLYLGRNALIAFASAVVVAPVFLFALSPDYMDATWDYGLIRCLYGFSLGVLVHAVHRVSGSDVADTMDARLAWTFAEAATVVAVVLFVIVGHAGPVSLAAPFVFGLAVLVFANEAGYVSRLLSGRLFLGLGALSYSIYMTHLFVQGRMLNVAKLAGQALGIPFLTEGSSGPVFTAEWALPAAVLMVAATIAASLITYRLVEMPGRDWFRNMARRIT